MCFAAPPAVRLGVLLLYLATEDLLIFFILRRLERKYLALHQLRSPSHTRLAAASSVAASDSDDTGRPEDTPVDLPDFGSSVEAILDGGIGSGGFSSLSSSSSARRLSVLTDMACSRPAGDTDRMPLAGLPIGGITPAALPPPPIEDQNSLVMALRETVDKPMPGQSRFVVSKR